MNYIFVYKNKITEIKFYALNCRENVLIYVLTMAVFALIEISKFTKNYNVADHSH
jgi:hypothetical protein